MAYDDAFKDKLPYNVAIVELDEGPRMITNILDCPDGRGLSMDMRVKLSITHAEDQVLATFVRDTV